MGAFSGSASPQCVEVFALPTGRLSLSDRFLFEDGDPDLFKARQDSPDYSFLISHPSGKKIMFDLGLAKNLDIHPPAVKRAYAVFEPQVPKDAWDLISEGPISPSDIDAIVLSHLHFDHVGDPSMFPDIPLIAGPGSRAGSGPGWPIEPTSTIMASILSHKYYRELDWDNDTWSPLGPFPRSHDFFGDGSFWIIDAPGHAPGHVMGLAQTSPDEWVVMGGDCCHHRALLEGSRPIGVSGFPGGKSFHEDLSVAIETIGKVRDLDKDSTVLVVLAHDATMDGKMPLYPRSLNSWRSSEWKRRLDVIRGKKVNSA